MECKDLREHVVTSLVSCFPPPASPSHEAEQRSGVRYPHAERRRLRGPSLSMQEAMHCRVSCRRLQSLPSTASSTKQAGSNASSAHRARFIYAHRSQAPLVVPSAPARTASSASRSFSRSFVTNASSSLSGAGWSGRKISHTYARTSSLQLGRTIWSRRYCGGTHGRDEISAGG